jgi:hypothetical protein
MKHTNVSTFATSRKLFKLLTLLVAFALLTGAPARAWPRAASVAQTSSQSAEVTAVVEDVPELNRTVVNTPHGKFFLNFPKYATPGSEVSGTLFAEPAGQTPAEREKNAAVLKLYSVEIGGRRIEPDGTAFKTNVAVRDATNVVINVPKDLKLKPKQLTLKPPDPPPTVPKEFSLPPYGQAGGFLAIKGPFDGVVDASDYVSVGGKPALTLAESTTSKVVLNDSDAVGFTQLKVKEQGRVVSGDYRNISIKATITKPKTSTGEQSVATFTVSGLKDLKEDIPLDIENRSPTVVKMERGERESITIHPSDVQQDGTFTLSRNVISLHPGAFSIVGRVTWKERAGDTVVVWPQAAVGAPTDTRGLPHRPLGAARLGVVQDGALSVSNLGPEGDAGVSIALGSRESFSVKLELNGRDERGALLEVPIKGMVNGVPDQPVGVMRLKFDGRRTFLTTDFSPLGSTLNTIEVYKGGQLLARRTGVGAHTGREDIPFDDPPKEDHPAFVVVILIIIIIIIASAGELHVAYQPGDDVAGVDGGLRAERGSEIRVKPERIKARVTAITGVDIKAGGMSRFIIRDESH